MKFLFYRRMKNECKRQEKMGNDFNKVDAILYYCLWSYRYCSGLISCLFFQGEFPYDVFAGGLVATIILTIIQVIKQKRKKDNLPEADERVIHNVFRFFAYASHLSLAILFIALAVFTLLGNESISILYLWIFFFSYIWIFGIGAILIKRR